MNRIYPIGAEIIADRGVNFRVWAPEHPSLEVVVDRTGFKMEREENGYFSCLAPEAREGSLYSFKLAHFPKLLPDPGSRFQPAGPEGPSCVINPHYAWTDQDWPGIASIENQIIYELHIGTFTFEGSFEAAIRYLQELAELGITLIELMPINEFPGKFNWGYEGVNLFAPSHNYGLPEDLKHFINEAHRLKLGVILDVVYNHFGPESNYIDVFSSEYFDHRYKTDWGKAINFDNPQSREFFLTNARYWIDEYHFDGLRIDSTSSMYDTTEKHILSELSEVVKKSGKNRRTIIIGENEPQDTRLLKTREKGGKGFDALWNDDFHHTVLVKLTGKREAYYTDYLGTPQEFISLYKYGYLYQGQYYEWHKESRGIANLFLSPASLIIFLENHDQIANSLKGKRLSQFVDAANLRAMAAVMMLAPQTPMLFQGQEFGASQDFYFFSDHLDDLKGPIHLGRKEFLYQFSSVVDADRHNVIPDPSDLYSFVKCKLNHSRKKREVVNFYRDLISIRKNDSVFQKIAHIKIDGEILNTEAWIIRYFGDNHNDRLLIVNLGSDFLLVPNPHPLMAPMRQTDWRLMWSSESYQYGGGGTPAIKNPWQIPGHCALLLELVHLEG
jgi:maltooligosyltrehalose trehalohydrolase